MPKTSFLFWNAGKTAQPELIAKLVRERGVEVVVLAEYVHEPGELIRALNARGTQVFRKAPGLCERIQVFTAFPLRFVKPRAEGGTFSILSIKLPLRSDILLAAVHLPSKIFWSDDSQAMECTAFIRELCGTEDKAGHARSILVGDFNMDPFEKGMVGAAGLHAVMSQETARRGQRTVQGRQYRYFYNPMWGRMGDLSSGPPGTYYHERSEQVSYYWHMFDQVLIRPELTAGFDTDALTVVTSIGGVSLLGQNGTPDRDLGSDHLPLVFSVEF